MKNKKNILIIIFVILGMYFALSFKDHNFKRAVDACLAGSQKLSESKITDLEKLVNFVKIRLKRINNSCLRLKIFSQKIKLLQ